MARKREGIVHESVAELRTLASHYQGTFEESRIHMLLAFREDPKARIRDVAEQIQYSEKTVRRWWGQYVDGGLDRLLSERDVVTKRERATLRTSRTDRSIPLHVQDFLNSLPISKNTVEWIEAVRSGIGKLLGDVDRVTINVNINNDPDRRGDLKDGWVMVAEHVLPQRRGRGSNKIITTAQIVESPSQILIGQAISNGFPIHLYQPPQYFDYYLASDRYLGTIILWRERNRRPISAESLKTMQLLEPFLTFLLSDCVTRRQQSDPGVQIFKEVVDTVAQQIGLTPRQQEVFLLQIVGRSHDSIAELLHITHRTVSKHIQAIYQKAGTHSHSELFARFFTPLKVP